MCGRFTLRARLNLIVKELSLFGDLDEPPRFNIAPTQPVPVVRKDAEGRRTVAVARWGLCPAWAAEAKPNAAMINARSETVEEKPAFRSAFKRRRCLVLADGYYEWRAAGKFKQPYFIRRADDAPFGFAGLWETRPGADGSPLETCTVITTAANDLTRSVHDRMPVIFDPDAWDAWLAPDADPATLLALLQPYPSDRLAIGPVSPLVNSSRNDLPECVKPFVPD
jgi:putative SOS response-associated peptidase YedK